MASQSNAAVAAATSTTHPALATTLPTKIYFWGNDDDDDEDYDEIDEIDDEPLAGDVHTPSGPKPPQEKAPRRSSLETLILTQKLIDALRAGPATRLNFDDRFAAIGEGENVSFRCSSLVLLPLSSTLGRPGGCLD
jgi:hypothetical protein